MKRNVGRIAAVISIVVGMASDPETVIVNLAIIGGIVLLVDAAEPFLRATKRVWFRLMRPKKRIKPA